MFKYININNFNTSNSNYKRGIRLTNTNCEIENLSVINSNISNSAGEVSILYESGNCNIKNINSIWVNETDSNRFNGNIELLNFDKFNSKLFIFNNGGWLC